jgi:hypothetical protein
MKSALRLLRKTILCLPALAGVWAASQLVVNGAEDLKSDAEVTTAITTVNAEDAPSASDLRDTKKKNKSIVIKSIEANRPDRWRNGPPSPWLGVSLEEASETLSAQLGLNRGVGLVVTYVTTNSPAAKAGLQRNDVLVEFEDQWLVHPAQLRKLVQARQEGDAVKLVFYRAGKKQAVTATLTKNETSYGWLDGDSGWQLDLRDLQNQFRNLPVGDAIRDQMKTLRESLGHVQIDQQKIQAEVRHSIEQARKAYQDAMRQAHQAQSALGPMHQALEDLGKSADAMGSHHQTVTVRSTGQSSKSMVTSDDSGTIVLFSNPKPHLTAHDKDGKLLFDGEIETSEQRDQVPRVLWKKVEPMLDKMNQDGLQPDVPPAPAHRAGF